MRSLAVANLGANMLLVRIKMHTLRGYLTLMVFTHAERPPPMGESNGTLCYAINTLGIRFDPA
jgi:hypothetical protein